MITLDFQPARLLPGTGAMISAVLDRPLTWGAHDSFLVIDASGPEGRPIMLPTPELWIGANAFDLRVKRRAGRGRQLNVWKIVVRRELRRVLPGIWFTLNIANGNDHAITIDRAWCELAEAPEVIR